MQSSNQMLSYARAIFGMTKQKETQEKYYQQIAALDAMNKTNADFFDILSSRAVDKEERKELAMTVLSSCGFEPIVIYWVWAIIDCNCYHNYHHIAILCRDMYHNLFDIVRVKITSADILSESQIDKIKSFFEKTIKRKIDIEWQIKPNLIGGLTIQVNNKTFNNTIRSKLDNLKKQLLSRRG